MKAWLKKIGSGFCYAVGAILALLLIGGIAWIFIEETGESFWTVLGTVVTVVAAVVALFISCQANRINTRMLEEQKRINDFSLKPQIQCYLKTYFTQAKTPYIVLITENFGQIIAREIQLSIEYPDGLKNTLFHSDSELELLMKTKFTLAPRARLSTPICWNRKRDNLQEVINGNIRIKGEFSYFDMDGKWTKGTIPETKLTVDEFRLFNAINVRKDEENGQS